MPKWADLQAFTQSPVTNLDAPAILHWSQPWSFIKKTWLHACPKFRVILTILSIFLWNLSFYNYLRTYWNPPANSTRKKNWLKTGMFLRWFVTLVRRGIYNEPTVQQVIIIVTAKYGAGELLPQAIIVAEYVSNLLFYWLTMFLTYYATDLLCY